MHIESILLLSNHSTTEWTICERSIILYRPTSFSSLHKAKASPVQDLRVPGGWDAQISELSAISRMHRPSLPPPKQYFLVPIFVRGSIDPRAIVRPEGISQWRIPMIQSGIEPASSQCVAQCLNQLPHRVPQFTAYWTQVTRTSCSTTDCP